MADGILILLTVGFSVGAFMGSSTADSASGHVMLVVFGWGFMTAAVCLVGGVVWKLAKPARDRAEGRRNKRITDQVMKEE